MLIVIAGVVVGFVTVPAKPFALATDMDVTVPLPPPVLLMVVVPPELITLIPLPATIVCAATVLPFMEDIPPPVDDGKSM